jgi:hypothetical protein
MGVVALRAVPCGENAHTALAEMANGECIDESQRKGNFSEFGPEMLSMLD